MAGRFRSEVTRSDGSSVAIVVDPPDLTADQHATAQAILDEHVQRAADATGIGWSRGENTNAYSKPHAGILNDEDTGCRDQVLALLPGVPGIVFGSFYAPFPADVAQVLVWHKPDDAGVVGSVTGYRRDAEPIFLTGPWPSRKVRWPSVLRSNQRSIKAVTVKTGHPHTKPVDPLQGLIERAPVPSSAIVADPFAGSGSTLVAAKRLGRKAIGVELEERYCEIAAKRLAQGVLDFGAIAAEVDA